MKKSTRAQEKAKGHGKGKRKPSKVKDLPAGSRARSVKGGSFNGKLGTVGRGMAINKYTIQ